MQHRAPLSHPLWQQIPGLLLGGALSLLVVAGMSSLLTSVDSDDIRSLWENAYLRGVIAFTVWQATLSVGLSLLIALPVARALARHPVFPGRAWLLRLMEMSLVLPTIVAVSGIIAVYGRQGWMTHLLNQWIPGHQWNLYGLNGILLAHVFFNAPLMARLLLQALESVPAARLRNASQLGLRGWWLWRGVEWPAIKPVLPGLSALVFTLCFTSFAIIMTLGGGPRYTTLEVAIYQSLRFEFDFARAALLALVQLGICGTLWWLVFRRRLDTALLPDRRLGAHTPLRAGQRQRLLNGMLLGLFGAFLMVPLLAVVMRGLPALLPSQAGSGFYVSLLDATAKSLLIAVPAGAGAVIASLLTLASVGSLRQKWLAPVPTLTGFLPLIVPPMVLGTGLFLLFRPGVGQSGTGWVLVSLINGLMAIPFVLQILRGPLRSLDEATQRQADQIGLHGWYRWVWLHWPRLKKPVALALAYGITLSLGDFGVIALFGSPAEPTLPVLLYQQLGSYRVAEAAGTSLWLLVLLAGIFIILSRFTEHRHA